jgi:superfamily I DNA/RNA helicase
LFHGIQPTAAGPGVTLSTFHSLKGLEFKAVLLYVAMTRAVAVLKITGTGIASDLIRI